MLLTWPPDGLSDHPNHVAVSRWAALAFERASALGQDAPVALYHLAVPRSVAEALGLAHLHAIPDEEVTLAVDVMPVWEQKLAAIRCHRTQLGGSPILAAPEDRQRMFLGVEHFRRAAARDGHDFFERMSLSLMNHAVLGMGLLSPWLDLLVLLASGVLFMLPPVWMHQRGRVLGY